MKPFVLLVTMPFLIGCGMQSDTARDRIPQVEVAAEGPATSEPDDLDNAYAKGVVTRKDGKRVVGHILLQCPGYLTVCFEINSSELWPIPIDLQH
jgi:hypothetical protein